MGNDPRLLFPGRKDGSCRKRGGSVQCLECMGHERVWIAHYTADAQAMCPGRDGLQCAIGWCCVEPEAALCCYGSRGWKLPRARDLLGAQPACLGEHGRRSSW